MNNFTTHYTFYILFRFPLIWAQSTISSEKKPSKQSEFSIEMMYLLQSLKTSLI